MKKLQRHLYVFICLCSLNLAAQDTTVKPTKPNVYAKFGKGINFMAADSSVSVKMGVRFQTLFVAEKSLADNSPVEKELMIRRFRLKFDGFAFTPKLEYKIELAISNRDNGPVISQSSNGANIVLDAAIKYHLSRNSELWFGQTKLPGNRERVISSQALQFVDRSIVNGAYNLDRDIGIQLHHKFNLGDVVIKDKYAVSLGQGRNITKSDTGGLSYTGRIEVLPFGEFTNKGDYFDADLEREPKLKLSLGAGYSYNDDAIRSNGELGSFLPESRDLKTLFTDIMLKYRGWSVTAEYMDKGSNSSPILSDSSDFFQTGTGLNIQSGYLFRNNIEVAGRYSVINPDMLLKNFMEEGKVEEYTLGVSKYFSGHNLKIQTDVSHIRNYMDDDPSIRFRFQVELAL